MSKHDKNLSDENGSIALLVAFLLLIFVAFLGLAVDFGYAYLQRSRLQSVADAEALACVISPSASPCPTSGGNLYPQVNPYGFNVTTSNPGDSSLCLDPITQSFCASATAQTSWNTFFINLFGVNSLNLSATAVAAKPRNVPSCMITTQNFSANGTNIVNLNNCAASIGGTLNTTNQSGIGITGKGTTTVFNGNSTTNCGGCNPQPVGQPGAVPDLPSPTVPTKNINGSTLATLPYTSCTNSSCVPAIYTGGVVSLSSATTLSSGYYVFNGGFSNNGQTLNSAAGGVGLYIPGNMPLSLTGTVNLTAPSLLGCTEGSGIVISHPFQSSYNSLTLSGSGNSLNLTGVVNLGADNITVNGSPVAITVTGSLVAHSIVLHGNMNPQASSNPCFNLFENNGMPILID
jgi:Putative Flp pilus-assembly TadE/G-like